MNNNYYDLHAINIYKFQLTNYNFGEPTRTTFNNYSLNACVGIFPQIAMKLL